MKKTLCLVIGLLAVNITSLLGQPNSIRPLRGPMPMQTPGTQDQSKLTRFNLDFRGGSPRDLVASITNATGKPLNVIISDEDDSKTVLPALKMNDVDVEQLFSALASASIKRVNSRISPGSYTTFTADYGFRLSENSPVSDDTIWSFYVDDVPPPAVQKEKSVRFYALAPYLNRGLTVDDITTAIQTGWKMANSNPAPELNYHKETKMLIAYGEPNELKTIDDVLSSLPASDVNVARQVDTLEKKVDRLEKQIAVKEEPNAAVPKGTSASGTEEKSGK